MNFVAATVDCARIHTVQEKIIVFRNSTKSPNIMHVLGLRKNHVTQNSRNLDFSNILTNANDNSLNYAWYRKKSRMSGIHIKQSQNSGIGGYRS